jgi:hypothetical protein
MSSATFLPSPDLDENEPWQEEWRFHLDQENKSEIRGYLQFGGRLNAKEHFAPRAQQVCKEHNYILLRVEEFKASVDFGKDLYHVSALVTLKRANP